MDLSLLNKNVSGHFSDGRVGSLWSLSTATYWQGGKGLLYRHFPHSFIFHLVICGCLTLKTLE